jgi:hypothetical protein
MDFITVTQIDTISGAQRPTYINAEHVRLVSQNNAGNGIINIGTMANVVVLESAEQILSLLKAVVEGRH